MKTQTKQVETNSNGDGSSPATHIFSHSKDSVASEYHNFLSDIEDMVKSTASLTGEELVQAKALIGERVQQARKSIEDMGGAIAKKARSSAKATDSYVHENPWQAIGIGAALGLVLGVVVARRK